MGEVQKYDVTPDPAFEAGVLQFPWKDWVDGGVKVGRVASGNCPRCGHVIALWRDYTLADAVSNEFDAVCNCLQPHAERPQNVSQGCGQKATIDLRGWDPEFGRT